MSRRLKPLTRLEGAQRDASDPQGSVWLSASAGTGKTHVLTARVLRLLLCGADPSAILCLTFTKAGAAEMAERVHDRLTSWVRMKDGRLGEELAALGAPVTPESRRDARRLFAKVLDASGGGLRIQTIHAFCATLLAAFPAEAGLVPGFRPIEEREEQRLSRQTLAELLTEAEEGGRLGLLDDVAALSRRLGEEEAERFLHQCARVPDAMAALGGGIEAQLRRTLGVPADDIEAALAEACADERFDCATLGRVERANRAWGTKSGVARADAIAAWLGGAVAERAQGMAELHKVWATDKGPRSFGKGQAPQDEGYGEDAARLHGACAALLAIREKAAFATILAAALRAGQAYAARYAAAKRAAGLVDFDDLIRRATALLGVPGIADWVRYKLDQATDHILVDEGQDTNARQWSIVAALTEEFFAGESAKPSRRTRTLFTVGDYKQAIFGFQGTDPRAFALAERYFADKAREARHPFARLSLERSFRSTPPVLQLVDRLLADIGGELGLPEAPELHRSARDGQPGRVTLWRALSAQAGDDEDTDGEEEWIDDATRALAGRIARQVKAWLDEPLWLAGKARALRPEDVMILVRRRSTLAALLVARLHEEGVAVAGVDRLRLSAPLAVQDLLATIRFVLQPEDDLNLASLLVSPLLGLSQDDLFTLAYDRPGSLLTSVSTNAAFAGTAATLNALLDAADFGTPHQFLEAILSGSMDGRRKLVGRLGEEARDPIEELLNAALGFETEDMPSLQLFLDWFERGDVEIKRDPSAPLDAVRVMTVHGAKGLQAPLVILADAAFDPGKLRKRAPVWEREESGDVPIFRPRKEERFPPFDEAVAEADLREREEHWRLLYVALTRAEEHLVVAGALGPSAKGVPPAGSWYQAVNAALAGLGAEWSPDARWGEARHHVGGGAPARVPKPRQAPAPPPLEPVWLRAAAPVEARPPRPLAPSSLGRDDVADPPLPPGSIDAARRGRLLHALFERLPALPVERRGELGDRWLMQAHGLDDAGLRAALVADACAIIADPRFADVFGPGALAEAPIAAVVSGEVIAGTVDRLCVGAERVLVVDFKTGRRAPANLAEVPAHHLAQIGAYAAALAVIFPDRRVEAALLYTAAPRLIAIPAGVLAAHKPGFAVVEQSLAAGG